ncbi:hypothetical protein [Tunicatimonas pelagia]|uniref:hypothetical protein n=1 Tax=Tunicatimonas pelagia TaxID=931531 RepID=UPI002666A0BA|nr:hypothetical protein [Tunicatimonas pelagia]WKN43308.1 hypothetical protein P0M28_30145 [Tunicatimonas pelagia]
MMGASGVISAMKKSYENNRALLRRKGTFEVLKNHHKNNPSYRANIANNYEALKQLRYEQEIKRKKARWYTLLVAIGLLAVLLSGLSLLY